MTASAPTSAVAKAIPTRRDQLQSRLLTLLLSLALAAVTLLYLLTRPIDLGTIEILGVSLAFAALTLALRAATLPGALSGALVCLCLTGWTSSDPDRPLLGSALPPLITLFILTFLATRAGRRRKEQQGLAERRSGRRASQVLANLGIAALIASPAGAFCAHLLGHPLPIAPELLATAAIAALAEATADTVSSEFGQAFGARTLLITDLTRVPRGTDGGISLAGTVAGIIACAMLVAVGTWSLHLTRTMAWTALLGGVLGLLADGLLGATAERRGWIGNDIVNLTSTAVSALLALVAAHIR